MRICPSQGILLLEISQSTTPRLKMSDFFPRLYDASLNDKGSMYAAVPSPLDMDVLCFNAADKPKSVILAMPDCIRILLED